MSIHLGNVVIETTRRCNMSCDHCLRGDAQNLDMPNRWIESFFQQMAGGSISYLTFSGGEPALNAEIIRDCLTLAIMHKVQVDSFYIATGGADITVEFVVAALKWFSYCEDKDSCQIHVSNDYFHQIEGRYSTELLDGLSFFGRKFETEGDTYGTDGSNGGVTAINQGNYAENYGDGQEEVADSFEDCEELKYNASLYLNCKGYLINGCDWSYENQHKNILCQVQDLTQFLDEFDERSWSCKSTDK